MRQQMIDAFIRDTGISGSILQSVNFFTNRFFLQKNLQAAVAMSSARNTFVLSLFNTMRQAQTAQSSDNIFFSENEASLEEKFRQTGMNAVWSWRLSPRTNVNINSTYSRINSISADREDRRKTLRFALATQFTKKMGGTIELRRISQVSNQSNSDFYEKAVSAALFMKF